MRLYILDTYAARPLYIISTLRLNGRTSRASLLCLTRNNPHFVIILTFTLENSYLFHQRKITFYCTWGHLQSLRHSDYRTMQNYWLYLNYTNFLHTFCLKTKVKFTVFCFKTKVKFTFFCFKTKYHTQITQKRDAFCCVSNWADARAVRPLYIISTLRLSGRTSRASLLYLINTFYLIASIT